MWCLQFDMTVTLKHSDSVGRRLPVGIGTDIIYERTVLENSLHFSKRDVLASLQFHQVLLAVYKIDQNRMYFEC